MTLTIAVDGPERFADKPVVRQRTRDVVAAVGEPSTSTQPVAEPDLAAIPSASVVIRHRRSP